MNYQQLMASLPQFADQASALADRLGFIRARLQADHIALRVTSLADAQALQQAFLERGQLLSEKMINGRLILLIQLNTPMQVGPWAIDLIELPYPDGKKRRNGWEHVELVLPCDAQDEQQMLMATRQLPAIIAKWPLLTDGSIGIKMKTSCPAGSGEPVANPTVAFEYEGISIKVHPWDIRQVLGLLPTNS